MAAAVAAHSPLTFDARSLQVTYGVTLSLLPSMGCSVSVVFLGSSRGKSEGLL